MFEQDVGGACAPARVPDTQAPVSAVRGQRILYERGTRAHPRSLGIEGSFEGHRAAEPDSRNTDVHTLLPIFGETFEIDRGQSHGLSKSVAECGRGGLADHPVAEIDGLAAKWHGIRVIPRSLRPPVPSGRARHEPRSHPRAAQRSDGLTRPSSGDQTAPMTSSAYISGQRSLAPSAEIDRARTPNRCASASWRLIWTSRSSLVAIDSEPLLIQPVAWPVSSSSLA